MKRIAAILLSFTVLLVHPAAAVLGQEPDIAIPAGAVVTGSEMRAGADAGVQTVSDPAAGTQAAGAADTQDRKSVV